MKHTLLFLALMTAAALAAENPPLPAAHTTRNIEGWTVRVDEFYPFVSGELKQAEPDTFALLAGIWSPLPGSAAPKPEARK